MKNFLLLSKGRIGDKYTIKKLCKDIDIKTKTRLLELGFFEGETIKILAKSLVGGVLLVEVRNSALTIRVTEAACVVVI
ncbi:MAG: ferrous iron transport protein A [Clostridia bacterium]|nr:ferrous iron transport protein A [Clostridia bacterium]